LSFVFWLLSSAFCLLFSAFCLPPTAYCPIRPPLPKNLKSKITVPRV
jgi:hypothetical protein